MNTEIQHVGALAVSVKNLVWNTCNELSRCTVVAETRLLLITPIDSGEHRQPAKAKRHLLLTTRGVFTQGSHITTGVGGGNVAELQLTASRGRIFVWIFWDGGEAGIFQS
jgi:hypothetical protein